jgi:hypothetical protein
MKMAVKYRWLKITYLYFFLFPFDWSDRTEPVAVTAGVAGAVVASGGHAHVVLEGDDGEQGQDWHKKLIGLKATGNNRVKINKN